MKINGRPVNFFTTKNVTIKDNTGNDIIFTIAALPIDFADEIERDIPSPTVPKTFAKDNKGKLEKDTNGRPVVVENYDDENYKKQKKEVESLQNAAMIYKSLQSDKNIEFDAKRENFSTPKDFYKAIYEEFKTVFSLQTFLTLVNETSKLIQIRKEEVEDASESFLSKANTQ